jgi:tetraacyldisaccharide 4'-kinase
VARHPEVDVILADDGLQHYALARDLEIVVIDAARGFGNGWLLPAGPLREPARRAAEAAAHVLNVANAQAAAGAPNVTAAQLGGSPPAFRMSMVASSIEPLRSGVALPQWHALPRGSVHAVAGIGEPQRFFAQLAALGIEAVPHAFDDHHAFVPGDLAFPGARAILMTEKDAVKCSAFADARMFYLPVRALVDPALVTLVEDTLHGRQTARAAGMPGHEGPAHV